MNYRKLGKILGKIMILEGILMILPLAVSFIYRESLIHNLAFLIPIILLTAIGFLLQIPKPNRNKLYQKEGFALTALFSWAKKMVEPVRLIITLGAAFLLYGAETQLKALGVPLSGLLGVMAMAFVIRAKCAPVMADTLSAGANKLWSAAEILLFVLVGAAVDIRYMANAVVPALAMIALGLVFRSVGTWVCLYGTRLNRRERLFCVIAYLPKATVQAAIGAVPLSMGLACGSMTLSVAVLAILVTAPLGALAIEQSAPKLLARE